MTAAPTIMVPAGFQNSGPDIRNAPFDLGVYSGTAGQSTTIPIAGLYRSVVPDATLLIVSDDGSVFASGIAVTVKGVAEQVSQVSVEVPDQFPLDESQPTRYVWLVNSSQGGEPSAYMGSYRILGLQ